ncbi:hypothetical protein F4678DRAFT_467266 [Xylaria arbuscula]|nr:hypothetical protein F4678DRAFT_467266 [Xylaria arbuscula]
MTEVGVDPPQCRMLAKMYLFLRDYVPQGLTGRFTHIRGHRNIEASFTQLREWMGKGKNLWESMKNNVAEAKKNNEAEASKSDGVEKRKTL